jgi:hypothetical protein
MVLKAAPQLQPDSEGRLIGPDGHGVDSDGRRIYPDAITGFQRLRATIRLDNNSTWRELSTLTREVIIDALLSDSPRRARRAARNERRIPAPSATEAHGRIEAAIQRRFQRGRAREVRAA